MIVYLIDSRAPAAPPPRSLEALQQHQDDFEQGWRRVVRALPGHADAQIVIAGPGDNIAGLMQSIRAAVRTANTIWLLRILAHGNQGFVQLGRGLRLSEAHQFLLIAALMTPNGKGIEIHGCEVGGGSHGRRLLQRIANAIGMQVAASPGWQGADNRFQFEGQMTTVQPQRGRR
jgi:hypothetical protein